MINFTHYKEDSNIKLIFSLDWFVFEDHWTQRYMFDRPMWKEEDMEKIKLRNEGRYKRFGIRFNIMHHIFGIDFKLKKIGNLYFGRQLHDSPKQSPLKRRKQK